VGFLNLLEKKNASDKKCPAFSTRREKSRALKQTLMQELLIGRPGLI